LRGTTTDGLTGEDDGVAFGTMGMTIAGGGGAVGVAATAIAGSAGRETGGGADANVGALASQGDGTLDIGSDCTGNSGRDNGVDAAEGDVGGTNDRAIATKSRGLAPSLGGGGVGPAGEYGAICMTGIWSLIGSETLGRTVGG